MYVCMLAKSVTKSGVKDTRRAVYVTTTKYVPYCASRAIPHYTYTTYPTHGQYGVGNSTLRMRQWGVEALRQTWSLQGLYISWRPRCTTVPSCVSYLYIRSTYVLDDVNVASANAGRRASTHSTAQHTIPPIRTEYSTPCPK